MTWTIDLMKEEHANISRMLEVIRQASIGILEGKPVDVADFRNMVDFVRRYADKHHHGKEEVYLFPVMVQKLGRVADNLVTHGMLVEHDLGRDHVMSLATALDEYEKEPKTEYKLDILTEAMGYARLLKRHVEKENNVVYTFAENQLSQEDLADIDARSKKFEDEETEKGIQEHYLGMLEALEKKYIQS
ncbi:hemerythrin domain-containing protein [Acidaminococcus timonensis]|uniref:hemerythrin domain-containing protein n=1 Tax=Acidaminococcus timonensis TaxID=1871002 RepID=UPI00307DE106